MHSSRRPRSPIGSSRRAAFSSGPASQTISFSLPTGFSQTYGAAPFDISSYASASSGLAVSFSIDPSTSSVCSSGGTNSATITILAAGTCTIDANQAGNSDYSPASQVQQSFPVNQAPQTITFAPLPNRVLGDPSFVVSASGGDSGNPVTFTASPSTVCTASGTTGATITLIGVGTCTVTASQQGTANYLAATPVQESFSVTPLAPTLAVSPTTATTGQTVTASASMGNHASTAKTVSGTITLTYTGSSGTWSLTVPYKLKLGAGQTLSQKATFTVRSFWPRGTYTVTVKATDSDGSMTSSASLTVT